MNILIEKDIKCFDVKKIDKKINNTFFIFKNNIQKTFLCLTSLALFTNVGVNTVQAQSITKDGSTSTNITQNGNNIDIGGGTRAGDNLFHSFRKFGLTKDQVANFLSNPDIKNILGRVTGGDASYINGLIKVSGGNSNLFLINPAGIVFGKDATLNIPGSFTATTANGIQIGDFWFDALGSNNYSNLVGEPNGFAFVTDNPGAIVNAGTIQVGQGETINLVGGVVINTGTLEAEGGKINITAVPEKQLVRISPEGSLLSLALPMDDAGIESLGTELITPQDLPTLLTGNSEIAAATGVEVADNGTIKLTGSDTVIPSESGTAIASGEVDVSGNSGGEINVLGDKVGIIAANIDASGTNGGGTILIGGDYKGQGEVLNASRTFIDTDSVITADALTDGDGGKVIAWADEVTAFYGNISATGGSDSGNGGFVEVSGKEGLIFEGDVNLTAASGSDGMLLLDPAIIRIVDEGANDEEIEENDNSEIGFDENPGETFTISADRLTGKVVVLEATQEITFEISEDSNESLGQNSFPAFLDLTARVIPPEGETGTIKVLGDIAALKNFVLENQNGDIIIGQSGKPQDIAIGFNGNLDISQNNLQPEGDPTAKIIAKNGVIELFGGILITRNTSLIVDAQRFIAKETTETIGIRNVLNGGQVSQNIGIVYSGFRVDEPNSDETAQEIIDKVEMVEEGKNVEGISEDEQPPNIKLSLQFLNEISNNKEPIVRNIINNSDNSEFETNISFNLREDLSFNPGENFDPDESNAGSGILEPIQTIALITTDGSVVRGKPSTDNNPFSVGLIEPPNNDNQLDEEESETEFVAVNLVDETQTASFCNEELDISSIAGSDQIKATCGEQALAFVFTQPIDEEGNPVTITEDLFPELLTGDELIEIDENTSFDFWLPEDKDGKGSYFGFTFNKNNVQ